jgi:hypothetical protein
LYLTAPVLIEGTGVPVVDFSEWTKLSDQFLLKGGEVIVVIFGAFDE